MKIKYVGAFSLFSGYGKVSIKSAKYLSKAGHEVKCVPVTDIEDEGEIRHLFDTKMEEPDVTIEHTIPREKIYDVLWTIFEYKPCTIFWKYALDNSRVVMTQSKYSRECLQTVTDRDISIVPNGIEPTFGLSRPPIELPGDTFRFLSIFEWVPRKQGELLIRGFCESFEPEDDVELWIKSSWGTENPLAAIPLILNDYPEMRNKVKYIKSYFTDMQMLYPLFDSYVQPSAGEGFGLTFLEAMCCGLKPIGPGFSGNLEFMNEHNSYLLECGDWEPIEAFGVGMFSPDAKWRVPIKEDLIEKMRRARDDNVKLSKSQQKRLRKKWSWSECVKKMEKVLN